MAGHRWPADRKLLGDFVHSPVALSKHGEDLAPITIGQGIEGSGLTCHCRTYGRCHSVTYWLP